MAVIEIAKIIVRRGQELQTGVPQLDAGEFGWAQDTEHLYIGKRVSEGAYNDRNTRILTENDLSTIMTSILNTSTAYSKYHYREFDEHIHASTSTVSAKLDNWVSLTDYGLAISTSTMVDITVVMQDAIADLFYNKPGFPDSWQRSEARRELRIPAGSYLITQPVNLPPYCTIIGEGAGLTRITYTNSENSMFRTVDATGSNFDADPDGMASGPNQAKSISIKGLTLEFDSTLTYAKSLLTLDNIDTALIENCDFGVNGALVPAQLGEGIALRGRGASGVELCKNITIKNCKFNGLQTGVLATGTVLRPVIDDCVFENLSFGIAMAYTGSDDSYQPRDGIFTKNKFRNIMSEGIFSGNFITRLDNNFVTNHVCSENQFYHVGNGLSLSDNTPTTSTYSVITLLSQGNKVDNNHFNRMNYAEITSSSTWYYNPLVVGNAKIMNNAVYGKDIATTATVSLVKIPLSGSEQMVTMDYQLYNDDFSRKGSVVFNVGPTGYSTIYDSFTFTDNASPFANVSSETGSTGTTLLVSVASNPSVQQVVDNPGNWYVSTSLNPNNSAYIENAYQSGGNYVIEIDSFNTSLAFVYPGNYVIYKSNNPDSNFSYQDNSGKNYVSLTFTPSTSTQYRLEYQLDIQI